MTLIDWQNASRSPLPARRAWDSLAALHASLADSLADPRLRLRFLWAYSRVVRRSGVAMPAFSRTVRDIERLSKQSRQRRSIRDQRQPGVTPMEQRLVWVAGEAVCAIPDIAANWPKPAVAPPFYVAHASGSLEHMLPDGRFANLIRGRSFAPFARFVAALRGKTWRSPGASLGRVLFHLQRYGIPAPQLYAFGHRITSRTSAEWFVLFEPPDGRQLAEAPRTSEVREQVDSLMKQFDEAGCVVRGEPFVVSETGRVSIGEIEAIRIR